MNVIVIEIGKTGGGTDIVEVWKDVPQSRERAEKLLSIYKDRPNDWAVWSVQKVRG